MQSRTKIEALLRAGDTGAEATVKGWVRTKRGNNYVNFIALNDGSTINSLQIVADPNVIAEGTLKQITTGACIAATGKLVESQGSGQKIRSIPVASRKDSMN